MYAILIEDSDCQNYYGICANCGKVKSMGFKRVCVECGFCDWSDFNNKKDIEEAAKKKILKEGEIEDQNIIQNKDLIKTILIASAIGIGLYFMIK